jgi:hypothetical protein
MAMDEFLPQWTPKEGFILAYDPDDLAPLNKDLRINYASERIIHVTVQMTEHERTGVPQEKVIQASAFNSVPSVPPHSYLSFDPV